MENKQEIQQTVTHLKEKFLLKKIVGKNNAFRELVNKIPVVAKSGVNVLLQGETGTGKELFARAIHYLSPRHSGPFIPVNAATLPTSLFENEVFGHAKEAFTDAKTFRPGIITEAEGGTIFLDEINTLERSSQAKLLRYLDENKYKPLGSQKYIPSDVRIITAANSDLLRMTSENEFARDLFYRLSVVSLHLPPLRERKEDIPLLINHFLAKYKHRFGAKTFSAEAIQALSLYEWPGNIRELENFIQEMMIMNNASIIGVGSIEKRKKRGLEPDLLPKFQDAKKTIIEQFEKDYLTVLLQMHNGNITHAAKMAGKDRRSLGRLVAKHGLVDHFKGSKDKNKTPAFV